MLNLTLESLPTLNAILNSCAFVCLISGYRAIKKGNKELHRNFMIATFIISALFLCSYLTYHYHAGHKLFPELGWIKTLYLAILVPHVILAVVMVPMILATFYFAWSEQWQRHKKIARLTFPIWCYVSFTGVIIYFFLRAFYFTT